MLPTFGDQAGNEDRAGSQHGIEIDLIDAFAPDLETGDDLDADIGKGFDRFPEAIAVICSEVARRHLLDMVTRREPLDILERADGQRPAARSLDHHAAIKAANLAGSAGLPPSLIYHLCRLLRRFQRFAAAG